MKQIISLILCLTLTAALLPATALAEDSICGDSHSWVEATCVAPNLYLPSGTCVDVSGGLAENAEICVYAETAVEPFTVGGSVIYLDNFKSDRDGYRVTALEETELALVEKTVCLTHTPGDPVTENEVPSTCTVAGTYDSVVY